MLGLQRSIHRSLVIGVLAAIAFAVIGMAGSAPVIAAPHAPVTAVGTIADGIAEPSESCPCSAADSASKQGCGHAPVVTSAARPLAPSLITLQRPLPPRRQSAGLNPQIDPPPPRSV